MDSLYVLGSIGKIFKILIVIKHCWPFCFPLVLKLFIIIWYCRNNFLAYSGHIRQAISTTDHRSNHREMLRHCLYSVICVFSNIAADFGSEANPSNNSIFFKLKHAVCRLLLFINERENSGHILPRQEIAIKLLY